MISNPSNKSLNDLSLPLLAPLIGDEEIGSCTSDFNDSCCTVGSNDEANIEHDNESFKNQSYWIIDSVIAGLLLPGLLWLNFVLALLTYPEETTAMFRPMIVNSTFLLFMVSVALYRKMAEECDFEHAVAILLPEIAMTVVLVLVLSKKVAMAFVALLAAIFILSVLGVENSLRVLLRHSRGLE